MNDFSVWASNGQHATPAERGRELAWIASGGQTGIVGPSSLLVRAMPTPRGEVRVGPGSFAIQATPGNGVAYDSAPGQSYLRRTYGTHTVGIRKTESSGGRTDVVGVVIHDPQYDGTTEGMTQADWDSHRFFEFIVVENMPGATQPTSFNALGKPFLPLARITIPPSTQTITDEMITDLRFLAWKQEDTQYVNLQDPADANMTMNSFWYPSFQVQGPVVPQWATHVKVMGQVTGLYLIGGSVQGRQRMRFWSGGQTQNTAEIPFRLEDASVRTQVPISGRLRLRPEHRGQPIDMRVEHRIDSGSGSARTRRWESWTQMTLVFEVAPTDEFDTDDNYWG